MLIEAAKENHLDLRNCVVIGDRWTDLLAADEVGCKKMFNGYYACCENCNI